MGANGLDEYWVPEHVKDYLRKLGFILPLDDMEPWIRSWDDWMSARGEFYDYRDKDGMGRVYAVHRRSIHPAMRVCKEWGSLLLNEEVKVVCDNQKATDWINAFFSSTNFMNAAQATVVRAFGLGTGAWALWLDLDKRKVRIRHYDARMVIPLSWDEDGISECAFVTRAFYRGKAVDQLQMHLRGNMGFSADLSPSAPSHENEGALLAHESEETYRIVTVCFDHEGNELAPAGILPIYDTGCPFPTFGIVKPAVTNTLVDMSPYGQSVFADAVDAVQAVGLTFDSLINEIDLSKMRVSRSRSSRRRCAPLRKARHSASPCRCSGTSPDSAFMPGRELCWETGRNCGQTRSSPVSLHIISAYQTSVLSQDMRSLSSAQSGYSRAFGATDADSSSSRFLARLTVA